MEVTNLHIRTFLKPLSFLPALLLMYMIYSFSAQEGDLSSSVSYKASCILVEAADSVFDMGLDDYQVSYYATKINGVTRKLAHMTEYFLLAVAVSFPLYVYGLHGILLMLLAGGLCIAFACGDEYHQSFVSGRSPSLKDVGIDSIGVFFGILLVRIIGWTGRMTIFRPIRKDGERKLSRKEKKLLKQQQAAGQNVPPYNAPYSNYSGGYNSYSNAGPYQNPHGNGYNSGYGGAGPYQNPSGDGYSGGYGSAGSYPNPSGDGYGGGYEGPYHGDYPNGPYYGQPYPYQPQAPQYMGKSENPDESSDELSEDMPLAHLLKRKK